MFPTHMQWSAFCVVAFLCLLNINGLTFMFFGVNQLGTPLLLLSSLLMVRQVIHPRYCLGLAGVIFSLSIILYVFFGTVYSFLGELDDAPKYIITYSSSVFIIYAVASFLSQLRTSEEHLRALFIIVWCSFLGTCSVFFQRNYFWFINFLH